MVIAVYIGIMIFFLLGGLWIAVALGGVAACATVPPLGFSGVLTLVASYAWSTGISFVLSAVAVFVLMGHLASQGGLMDRAYAGLSVILTGVPGGLLQTNIGACAVFAACSGTSLAAAATMSSVAYPEMIRRGYHRGMVLGSIAAGGTLGILIPPSIPMIVYAVFAGQSVGKLFMAGVVPGLLMAALFSLLIAIWARAKPQITGKLVSPARVTWKARLAATTKLWEPFLLACTVLGGIYAGVATPTEVGALGVTVALVLIAIRGSLSWSMLKVSLLRTVSTTSMILFIVVGAKLLAVSLVYYNIPTSFRDYMVSLNLTPLIFLIVIAFLYLVLGTVFEALGMMVVTLPFLIPVMQLMGIDLLWFGVMLTILIEMGQLTPPVGFNLYVLQGITGEAIGTIAKGCIPFLVVQLVCIVIIIAFPSLVLWLPNLMLG